MVELPVLSRSIEVRSLAPDPINKGITVKQEETTKGFKERYIWSREIPIAVKDNAIDVFMNTCIQEPEVYNELCYKLITAKSSDTFYMWLNTPGGVIDSAFMITDAMEKSKARIIGKLSGTVASAGTLITLACDEIEVADHTSFMIHNYSTGMQGKGHELKAYQTFTDRELNSAFSDIYKKFLSKDEIAEVIDGKDMWLNKAEVIGRWNRAKG